MPLMNFLELKDCVFIRGFPADANINVSDVRKYFQERVGKCCVEMTAHSKDKGRLFIALKFDSVAAAENAIERFNGKYIFDHKVLLNFWRAPKNMVHSGRFERNPYDLNSRRWDDKKRFDEETGESLRREDNFFRENNSRNTEHIPRDNACFNEQGEFNEESDDFRGYQQHVVMDRYETSDNHSYQEQSEQYSKYGWSSDRGGEGRYPVFDDEWNEWDSDFRGSSENLSERDYYERDEEFSYPRVEEFWHEREAHHGRRPDLVDQELTKDYDNDFLECGNYQDFKDSHHAHNERLPLQEVEGQSRYRGDHFCPRNDREWFDHREFTEENRRNSPPSDKTVQWPRWETVGPSNRTREPSDLDVVKDTSKRVPWNQDLRPRNQFKDLTSRNPALSEGRPRSDEWLRNTQENFRGRGRHSASPVNFRPIKIYGHRGFPLVGDASSQTRTDYARSRRSRGSLSPVRNTHSVNEGITGSSSVDLKPRETSPTNERLSLSCSEQGLGRKKRESRSYSPSQNAKTPSPRGRVTDGKEVDLRRSLMIHQQRKHLSLRERDSDYNLKHLDRGKRTSPGEPDKSRVSCSSGKSSSFSHVTNKKRRTDNDTRHDERTKRRRQTSVSIPDHGSTESQNVNSDSLRNRGKKETGESKKQSPRGPKGKPRKQRDPTTNSSNSNRADRFLSNLAAALAEGKVSTKRPGTAVRSSKEVTSNNERGGAYSKRGNSVNPAGQSEGSRPGGKRHQERNKAAAVLERSNQLPDIVEDVSCDKLAVEGDSEGDCTTPDKNVGNVEVSYCDDSSDQEVEKAADCDDSSNLFEDNSENDADPHVTVSSEDELLEINKNSSFIVDALGDDDMEINNNNLDGEEECDDSSEVSTDNSENADLYMNTENSIELDNLSSDEVFSKTNKNCSFIVDDEGNKDTLEVDNIDLRESTVSELRTKMDCMETLTEEEKNTCHDDQQMTSDESLREPSLKQEIKAYTENGVRDGTKPKSALRAHMEISPVKESPPKSDESEETCHPNENRDIGRHTPHEGVFLPVTSRPKVLKTLSDNPLTNDKNEADGSVCQKEEQKTMQRSKDSCLVVETEFPSDDTYITSSTKMFVYPATLNNKGNVDKQDEKSAAKKVMTGATIPDLDTSKAGCSNERLIDSESSLLKTSISGLKVNLGPSYQGSYNKEEPNYNGISQAACTTECQHAFARSMENMDKIQCECKNDYNNADNLDERAYRNIRSCDLNLHIDRNSNVKTETNREVLHTEKLEDSAKAISDKVYIKGISDAEQEMYKDETVSKICLGGDGNNSKGSCSQEHERFDAESIDVTKAEEGTRDVSNFQEERNSRKVSHSVEVTPLVKEGIQLVAADFQQVDMEISSDEEIQDISKSLSIRVDTDTSAVENDGYIPYSPSSPTWTSEEHRSPLPKEDLSLYSPSHPTNVSGSEAERRINVEDGSHEDGKHADNEPICESMDVGSDEPEKHNVTINTGSTGGSFTSSFSLSSSPKSGSELIPSISIPDDISDENSTSKHLTPNRDVETYNITEEGHSNNRDDLSGNPATKESYQDGLKFLRCQKRTRSLPTSASMDAKPEIAYATATKTYQGKDSEVLSDKSATENGLKNSPMSSRCQKTTKRFPISGSVDAKPKLAYVTASKTYLLYTNSGTQHKPRIFYATNDTTAGAARSLSLDTALGNCWPLAKKSTLCSSYTPVHCEQEPAVRTTPAADTEHRGKEENFDSHVGPLLSNGPLRAGAPLKISKDTSKRGEQEGAKVSAELNNLRANNMALLPDQGPDNCADCEVTGSVSSGDTESTVPSTNSDNTLPPKSDLEIEELLVIQTSMQSKQMDVPVENSRSNSLECVRDNEESLAIEAPFGTGKKNVPSEHHHNTEPKMRKVKSASNLFSSYISDMNVGPVKNSVILVTTDKRPVVTLSKNSDYRPDSEKIPLPTCSAQVKSTVPEMQGINAKSTPGEWSLGGIQQQAPCLQAAQAPPSLTAKSAFKKRPHPDSSKEASRPCKVSRKPLKLIIPTNRPPYHGVKRTASPGCSVTLSKNTSTSTITSVDVNLLAQVSPTDIVYGDRLCANEHGPQGSDKDLFTENDHSSGNISITCESKDSPSSKTDCSSATSKSGNTSLLTTNLATYDQGHTVVDNNNIMEHTAAKVSPDDKASCSGKESDWLAVKMERLRKKKDEIEQVYKQECHTVINVVKMLVSNDPRLEGLLQNAVRRTLQEMGQRCVKELERQARPGT